MVFQVLDYIIGSIGKDGLHLLHEPFCISCAKALDKFTNNCLVLRGPAICILRQKEFYEPVLNLFIRKVQMIELKLLVVALDGQVTALEQNGNGV